MASLQRDVVTRASVVFSRAETLLVVAPHPDDDVLGCGATAAVAASCGARVVVAYLTDGSASHPPTRAWSPTRLGRERAHEALAGLEQLGLAASTARFLHLPDGALATLGPAVGRAAIAALAAIITEVAPTILLLPWRRDPHPDHRAGSALARAAVAQARGVRVARTLEYGVWLTERGTVEDRPRDDEGTSVDVWYDGAVAARKRAAIGAHGSQTTGLPGLSPHGFLLPPAMIDRACSGHERFFEVRDAS